MWQDPTFIHHENYQQVRKKGKQLNLIKNIFKTPTATILLMAEWGGCRDPQV